MSKRASKKGSKKKGGKKSASKKTKKAKKSTKRSSKKAAHRKWGRCHRCALPIMGGSKGMATHNRRHHKGKK